MVFVPFIRECLHYVYTSIEYDIESLGELDSQALNHHPQYTDTAQLPLRGYAVSVFFQGL